MKSKAILGNLILLLFLNLISNKTIAQLDHPCGDINCTSNDFVLNSAFLASDINGTELTSSACDNGTTDAYICVKVKNKTSSSRLGLYVKTRLIENNQEVLLSNCFDQSMPANTEVTLCMPQSYSWSCASELTLTDYLVSWSVGNHDICPGGIIDCTATNKAKCVNRSEQNIKVDIPVVARFGYSCEPNGVFNDLSFQNQSIGGNDDQYTYTWSFSNGILNNSTLENPTNRYEAGTNSTTTSLIVTDANGATDQVSLDISINSCLQLPVDLISFTAKSIQNRISLFWETANEFNNSGFEIERSKDALNWDMISFVAADLSNKKIKEYKFTDAKTSTEKQYYRLKQIDNDGQFQYSDIISTESHQNKDVYIYPNPSHNQFQIKGIKHGTLTIFDNYGKILLNKEFKDSETINTFDLPSGSYNIKLISPFKTYHMKLIKE